MALKENKIVAYFISAKAELKKVSWPTRQEVTRFSLLVIGISLGVAAFLGIIDYILTIGLEIIIR
jgi:preprotein translocase subunit SecE